MKYSEILRNELESMAIGEESPIEHDDDELTATVERTETGWRLSLARFSSLYAGCPAEQYWSGEQEYQTATEAAAAIGSL